MQSFQTFLAAFLVPCQSPILRFFDDSAVCNLFCTRRRVIKLLHKNAPYLQCLYLQNTPSLTGSYSHPAAPSLGSEACLQINFPQNGSLFAYCHSRFLSGIESSLHDFFSCLSIFIFSILFFLERAIASCLLIASFVARSLSWTL